MKNLLTHAEGKWAVPAVIVFTGLLIWWLKINFINGDGYVHQLWAALYQIIALYGGILGLFFMSKWGGSRSVIGRAMLALSIGLLLQSFGQSSYSYYIFYQHIEVPYPSIGDIGYFGSVIAYLYGTWLLAKASGVRIKLKSLSHKMGAILIPLLALLVSYFIFLKGYTYDPSTSMLQVILDFGYPLGEALYLSVAILTFLYSRQLLGGIMRTPILVLIGALIIQYVADFMFLYQASRGLWSAGGINDLIYATSYLAMCIGLIYMGVTYYHIQETA